MDSEQPTRREIVRLAVLCEGGLALLACAIGWLTGLPPWEHLQCSAAAVGFGFLAAVPMLALLVVGALLPSGHRVTAIASQRVTLERDGQSQNLNF